MARLRKFRNGDVVLFQEEIAGLLEGPLTRTTYGVIVGYLKRPSGRGEYEVQRVTHPVNGGPYGPTTQLDTWVLEPTEYPVRKTVAKRVRANKRIGNAGVRGCACNCCVHTSLMASEVRKDGTFVWEADNGEVPEDQI